MNDAVAQIELIRETLKKLEKNFADLERLTKEEIEEKENELS